MKILIFLLLLAIVLAIVYVVWRKSRNSRPF